MSTNDVPGSKAANRDVLATGCWAEHDDGSLIFVEGVEGGTVVYSMFDMSRTPPVEYRDAMPQDGFEDQFSWDPDDDNIKWTWYDKTPFDWSRVMQSFPAGPKDPSAGSTLSAAARVAQSLGLQAQEIKDRGDGLQKAASQIAEGIVNAIRNLPR